MSFLYEEYDTLSKYGAISEKVSGSVLGNLNPRFVLRPYQVEALARFLYYLKNNHPTKVHLLFNMATGSGKTLIMACLILHLYELGYRNFLFFVNSTNIIGKTRDNFLNFGSSKYLFDSKIEFSGQPVKIEEVDNFEGANPNHINICFTTIQKLHSELYNPKENCLTFEGLKDKKFVLLSDESHHIQVQTQQSALPGALGNPNWENTVENIFSQNSQNMLFEFTATLDFQNRDIASKYLQKVIYRYDLKEFRNDGYSKDVNILQSDLDPKDRMLQAIILSQYRQEVAGQNNISLKPIVLFKAQRTIAESNKNQADFNQLIQDLQDTDVKKIQSRSNVGIIQRAFDFFSKHQISHSILVQKLRTNFAPNKCLNVNETNFDNNGLGLSDRQELIYQQRVLNSLEDKDNQIRAIFAVQKLNEGWDVLNLFDIVRLYQTRDSKNGKPGKTTIAEAQLIGRGARYFPFLFESEQNNFVRKFDENLEHDLRILEELHYHSINDSKYISELQTALKEKGIYDDNELQLELKLKEEFKAQDFYKHGLVYLNEQIKNKNEQIKSFSDLGVVSHNFEHKITSGHGEAKAVFAGNGNGSSNAIVTETEEINLSDIEQHIVCNAVAKNSFYTFDNLKKYFPHIKSMREFIASKDYLAKLSIRFVGVRTDITNLTNRDKFVALTKLLSQIELEVKRNTTEYKGTSEFKPHTIAHVFFDKTLKINKNSERSNGQEEFVLDKEWYGFTANYGTSEEKQFVRMMETQINSLSEDYEAIYLLRNELHVKIYNFQDGKAFAPDFLLFMKRKDGEAATYQIFIEPKGEFLTKFDQWKEDLLKEITERFKDNLIEFDGSRKYRIIGTPFYNYQNENEFKQALYSSLS